MRASAEMIDASGVGGVMAAAAAERQAGIAAAREAGAFDEPVAARPWRERADALLGKWRPPR
jgi:tRNA-dihydrouridine synthase